MQEMRSPERRNGSVISLEALRCVTWPRNDDIVATVQLTYKVTVGTRECRSYWSITVHRYAWYSVLRGPHPLLRNHNRRTQQTVNYYQGKFINYIYIYIYIQTTIMDNTIYISSGCELLCAWWCVRYKYLTTTKRMSHLIIKRLLIFFWQEM